MAHMPRKHEGGKHKNHESKAEHKKAGKMAHHGGKKHEGAGHGAEHKMAEVHVHHHHHHHTGGMHAKKK